MAILDPDGCAGVEFDDRINVNAKLHLGFEFRFRECSVKRRKSLDVVSVNKIAKKAKTPHRCNKVSLHKKFKLILEENGRNQTLTEFQIDFYILHRLMRILRFVCTQKYTVQWFCTFPVEVESCAKS